VTHPGRVPGRSHRPALRRDWRGRLARGLLQPAQQFIQTEAASGLVLLAATVVALAWANSAWSDSYFDLWRPTVSFETPLFGFNEDLGHLVNDGLMAVFFFVIGLEIKRELLRGELATPRKAALPVVAALGGMVAPALIYVAFNGAGAGAKGWGIPMATDIAFALGVLSLLGARVPLSLKVFLLAIAVVDDLGAILVIAVFYTDSLSPEAGLAALALLAVIVAARRAGVASLAVYAVLALCFWLAVLESGVHATVAGVVLAFLTPAGSAMARPGGPAREAPLELLERTLHPWASFAIVPIFALANAGIELSGGALRAASESAVTAGVAVGLVAGKPLGIMLATALAVRTGLAALPEGVSWRQIGGVGLLAGIGFTVSLFITGLAFDSPGLEAEAKLGILAASLVAGAAGFVALAAASPRQRDV
jgi:Na+:H+ antiporter, NhaA family